MANDNDWLVDFKSTLIGSGLENCSASTLYRTSWIDRANWRQRLDGGQLTCPFYAFDLGDQVEESEYCPMDGVVWRQPFTLYGIYETSDPNMSIAGDGLKPFDPESYVRAQAHLARKALMAYTSGQFQILPGTYPVIQSGSAVEPNRVLLLGEYDMYAFGLSGILIYGQYGTID